MAAMGLVAPRGEEAGAVRERKRKSEKPLQSQSQGARAGRGLRGGSRLCTAQHVLPSSRKAGSTDKCTRLSQAWKGLPASGTG